MALAAASKLGYSSAERQARIAAELGDVVGEPLEAEFGVTMEGGARDDEEPAGVPDRAPEQAARRVQLVGVGTGTSGGGMGAEVTDAADVRERSVDR